MGSNLHHKENGISVLKHSPERTKYPVTRFNNPTHFSFSFPLSFSLFPLSLFSSQFISRLQNISGISIEKKDPSFCYSILKRPSSSNEELQSLQDSIFQKLSDLELSQVSSLLFFYPSLLAFVTDRNFFSLSFPAPFLFSLPRSINSIGHTES